MKQLSLSLDEKKKVYGTIEYGNDINPLWYFVAVLVIAPFLPGRVAPSYISRYGFVAAVKQSFVVGIIPLLKGAFSIFKKKNLRNKIFDDIAKFYSVSAKIKVKIKNNMPVKHTIEYLDDLNYPEPYIIQTKFVNNNTFNIFWDMLGIAGDLENDIEVGGNLLIMEAGSYNRAFLMHLIIENYDYGTEAPKAIQEGNYEIRV